MRLGKKSHQHFHPDVNADTVVALMLWEQPNHFLIECNEGPLHKMELMSVIINGAKSPQ